MKKNLATRATTVMLTCACLEVHVEEKMFVDFGDMNCLDDVRNESVEQEKLQGKELVEAEVEKGAFVAERLSMGTQPTLAEMMLNDSPWTF